ncbi:MAG: sigma-70 family RNA polymerase sigma factor [bacterium]|nr:sigma-70 family RNA polymerase sigma factor [bacterium]
MAEDFERRIQAVKDGDNDAYRQIVQKMLPILRSFVASRSFPGMDVDDIVQRVFIEAYKSIGEYRQGTDFRAWMVTIARYQIMMDATRMRRQADYHSQFVPVAVAREMERRLADDETEDKRLPHMRTCLEQVRDSSRELLKFRYEEGLSMNQIATVLKRTTGAVRKELCVIRKRLHECIERKLALDAH